MDAVSINPAPGPLEHPRYRVIARGSDKLAVFFSGTGPKDHHFQWWKVAHEIDASVLLVNNGRNEWYQHGIPGLGLDVHETAASIKAWAKHLGAGAIYMVGSSMGGSAALLYGALTGAQVLAFASETRFDYPWSNSKRLLVKDRGIVVPDLAPLLRGAPGPFHLITGETEAIDLICAKHVSAAPTVRAVSLRGIGHDVPAQLRKDGVLSALLKAFLNHEPLPRLLDEGQGLRGEYSRLQYAAHCAVMERDWPSAADAARAALEIYPEAVLANKILGRALLMQGRWGEARASLLMTIGLSPDDPDAHYLYASAVSKSGEEMLALGLNQRIAERWPSFGRAHYSIALHHLAHGDKTAAIPHLERAVAAEPNRTTFKDRLARIRS